MSYTETTRAHASELLAEHTTLDSEDIEGIVETLDEAGLLATDLAREVRRLRLSTAGRRPVHTVDVDWGRGGMGARLHWLKHALSRG